MSDVPLVSVIVPAYKRPEMLARCLESLARQSFAPDRFEVIIVDDGSPEPLSAPPRLSNGRTRVLLVRQGNSGPASARNHGLAHARGDFVAFIDDDCEADTRWLEHLIAELQSRPGAGAGGTVVNALPHNPYSEASQILVSYVCEYYNRDPAHGRFFTTNNLAFPRQALVSAGGFAEEYVRAAAEDRELCNRWHAQGRELLTVADAVVWHRHDLTFRRFVRQHYNYGVGARQFRAALAARNGDPVRIEPLTFYLGLLKAPLVRRSMRGVVHMGLIAIAQVASSIGFFRTPALTGPAMTTRKATQ